MVGKKTKFRESKDNSSSESEEKIQITVVIPLFVKDKPWDSKQLIIMAAPVETAEPIHKICVF